MNSVPFFGLFSLSPRMYPQIETLAKIKRPTATSANARSNIRGVSSGSESEGGVSDDIDSDDENDSDFEASAAHRQKKADAKVGQGARGVGCTASQTVLLLAVQLYFLG